MKELPLIKFISSQKNESTKNIKSKLNLILMKLRSRVQENSVKFWKIQEDFGRFRKIQEDSGGFWRILFQPNHLQFLDTVEQGYFKIINLKSNNKPCKNITPIYIKIISGQISNISYDRSHIKKIFILINLNLI